MRLGYGGQYLHFTLRTNQPYPRQPKLHSLCQEVHKLKPCAKLIARTSWEKTVPRDLSVTIFFVLWSATQTESGSIYHTTKTAWHLARDTNNTAKPVDGTYSKNSDGVFEGEHARVVLWFSLKSSNEGPDLRFLRKWARCKVASLPHKMQ